MKKRIVASIFAALMVSSCASSGNSSVSISSSLTSSQTSSSSISSKSDSSSIIRSSSSSTISSSTISSSKSQSSSKSSSLVSSSSLSKSNISSSSKSYSSSSVDPSSLWDTSQDYLRTGVKEVNFYNFNDFHGATEYFSSDKTVEQGIYKLATYINDLKDENPDQFVLTSSGDMWQGSADSNITKGKLVLDWMDYCGFEAMCIGNHEFDWTIDTIIENQQYMPSIPFLACNIIDKNSHEPVDWAKPFTTITRNGVHIGIVGSIGKGITSDIVASNVANVYFDDPTNYVINASSYLKDNGADIILYLLHDTVGNVSTNLSPYVDLVFGGHTHSGEDRTLNSYIPMIQAYSNGTDIGNINIQYNFTSKKVSSSTKDIIDLRYKILDDDPYMVELYNTKYYTQVHSITDEICGYTSKDLTRYGTLESCATEGIHQYYVNNYNTYEIALVKHNAGRADIPSGYITYGDIYKSFPFENYLTVVKIKGAYLNSQTCYFTTYASQFDYFPYGQPTSFESNKYYYVLTMSYISEKYEYLSVYSVVEKFEGIYVRDCLKDYFAEEYPV